MLGVIIYNIYKPKSASARATFANLLQLSLVPLQRENQRPVGRPG